MKEAIVWSKMDLGDTLTLDGKKYRYVINPNTKPPLCKGCAVFEMDYCYCLPCNTTPYLMLEAVGVYEFTRDER